jgi:hypothetical protein
MENHPKMILKVVEALGLPGQPIYDRHPHDEKYCCNDGRLLAGDGRLLTASSIT